MNHIQQIPRCELSILDVWVHGDLLCQCRSVAATLSACLAWSPPYRGTYLPECPLPFQEKSHGHQARASPNQRREARTSGQGESISRISAPSQWSLQPFLMSLLLPEERRGRGMCRPARCGNFPHQAGGLGPPVTKERLLTTTCAYGLRQGTASAQDLGLNSFRKSARKFQKYLARGSLRVGR